MAKKILIIDDDADFVESTKIVLEASGYKVASVGNKQDSLEAIKKDMPDLIIMDVMMDKMSDGFDLTRRIKSDVKFRNIPIFMLTAIGEKTGFRFSAADSDNAWLPVNDYAEKPLKPEELLSRIGKLLSR